MAVVKVNMGKGAMPPVKLYGLTEIATAIGEDRRKVAVWHGRGKLPEADFVVGNRQFWHPSTIEPWIEANKRGKSKQGGQGG